MLSNVSIQKFALASACLLALMSAQAQTADGTVVISGQLNVNTCSLSITDTSGETTNKGVRTVDLGTISNDGNFSEGGLLGTKGQVALSLRNADNSGPCTISGTPNNWNLVLDLESNQVSTAKGLPFLTNQAATNASTGIGIALFDTINKRFTSLITGAGYGGTRLTQSNTGFGQGVAMSMGFQYVATSASAPSPGFVSVTLPFLIVYN